MDSKQGSVQPPSDEHVEAETPASNSDPSGDNGEEPELDTRFNPPPPSPWKRLALIVLVCLLFYFGFIMRAALIRDKKPKVVYASRYSKEHKFRPAASPVITETMKDGRVRVRGAYPTPTTTVAPVSTTAAKRRRSTQAGRASGGKSKRKKSSPAVAKQ